MKFPTLSIDSGGRRAKGRAFSVHLLAHLAAELGPNRERRPSWIALFGSESETRAVLANLRAGKYARADGDVFQIPKRWPLRWTFQAVPGGIVTVAYLPELFHLEPATPPSESIDFVFVPPLWWIEAQAESLRAEFGDDAPEAARAALFAAFLDRRSPLPLLHHLRFHLSLYRALTHEDGPLCPPTPETRESFRAIGLDTPLRVSLSQSTLSEIVISETTSFQQEELRRGKTRVPADCRILPFPAAPATQLRLDFAVA